MNVLEVRRRLLGADVQKKTAEGNPISVRSLARMRPGLKLYGHSTQQTTTGAQLLDANEVEQVEAYKILPVSLTAGTYNLSVEVESNDTDSNKILMFMFDDTGETGNKHSISSFLFNRGVRQDASFTVPEGKVCGFLYLYASDGYINSQGDSATFTRLMINEGSTAKPWEPYTGGEASPNPDYPQEIVSAGDDGSIQVDVGGRNIFDINQCVRLTQSVYGLKVEAQGDYFVISGTISVSEPEGSKVRPFQMCSYPEDLNGKHFITYVEESENIDPEYKWYVYSDKGDFDINISLKYVQNNTYTYLKFKLMVTDEPGTFPYEPYKQPQTLTVQTPNGLPGIPVTSGGNYTDSTGQQWICDEIDFKRGKYVQRIGSVLADGVVNKFVASADGSFWNLNTDHSAPGVISGKYYFSVYFPRDYFGANEPGEFIYVTAQKGQRYFNSIEDLNVFCIEKNTEGNPLIIYYPMEPIETDLIQEQMEAYASLHTNRPTTVVTATDDAGLELTYKTKKSLEVTD